MSIETPDKNQFGYAIRALEEINRVLDSLVVVTRDLAASYQKNEDVVRGIRENAVLAKEAAGRANGFLMSARNDLEEVYRHMPQFTATPRPSQPEPVEELTEHFGVPIALTDEQLLRIAKTASPMAN